MVATTKWDGSRFVELQLHPITLGYQTSRAERGRPKLASGADAARILETMATRSKAFGATVTVTGGVGYVVPAPQGSRLRASWGSATACPRGKDLLMEDSLDNIRRLRTALQVREDHAVGEPCDSDQDERYLPTI